MEFGRPPPNVGYMPFNDPIGRVQVNLRNKVLWDQFNVHTTEMIITKTGRRMYPHVIVTLTNLEPNEYYCLFLEFPLDRKCRFKFASGSGWTPSGNEETQSGRQMYTHPASPSTGAQWMNQEVSFNKVKLTNSTNTPLNGEQVILSSMHKYSPRLIIVKTANPEQLYNAPSKVFPLPETKFVAVTAYQNDDITQLKIAHNPFAKGFRETGKAKRKRNDQSLESPAKKSVASSTTSSPASSSASSVGSELDLDRTHVTHRTVAPLRPVDNRSYYSIPPALYYNSQYYPTTVPMCCQLQCLQRGYQYCPELQIILYRKYELMRQQELYDLKRREETRQREEQHRLYVERRQQEEQYRYRLYLEQREQEELLKVQQGEKQQQQEGQEEQLQQHQEGPGQEQQLQQHQDSQGVQEQQLQQQELEQEIVPKKVTDFSIKALLDR